jgi:hypothetical protein
MRRGRTMGVGVAVVVTVIVGMGVGHSQLLYYNITGVHVWAFSQGPPTEASCPSCPRRRASSTPRPFGSIIDVSGILDPRLRGDDDRVWLRVLATRSPEVCCLPCPQKSERAQGRPGARCTRGLVCQAHRIKRTRAYRFSGGIRPSLRNGLRLTSYSPR